MKMTAQSRITLYRAPAGWMADMTAHADRARILEALGTLQVPTAFTGQADAETVRHAIAARNPGVAILVDILSRRFPPL
jgi:hypothetical protein